MLDPHSVFDPDKSESQLISLSMLADDAIDDLPFGAIRLNAEGIILGYNRFESRLSGLAPARVIGKNFFTEVAPCTRVKEFEGRFRALAAGQGVGLVTFDFVFPFPFGAQRVSVLLTRHSQPGHVIMALIRR